MAEGRGRSITAWDSLVRRPKRLARAPIDRALDDADGNAPRMASRSRGNGGTRRCGSDDDKCPQEMTVPARHGVVVDLASRRTHFRAGPSGPDCAARRDTVRAPKLASATKSMCTSILQHADEGPLKSEPARDRLEVLRDQVDVPVLEVDRRRLDHVPGLADVKTQIVREDARSRASSALAARGLILGVVAGDRFVAVVSIVGFTGYRCGGGFDGARHDALGGVIDPRT
jgi:hypothetical protein